MAYTNNPNSRVHNSMQDSVKGLQQQSQASDVRNNSNYRVFQEINTDLDKIIAAKSMITQTVQQQNAMYANPTWQTFSDGDILAMPLLTNKHERLQQYRKIAKYHMCDWCFDEIADDFIHDDDRGEFIKLTLPDRLNKTQQSILQNQFQRFMGYFNLRDEGYNVIKRFLTEGELAWENVINPKYPEMGIIGVKFLPAEYYETLIDMQTGCPCGIVFDTESYSKDQREIFINSFNGSASIFNSISPMQYSFEFSKETCVPFLYNQITYINSGEYSNDYQISYSLCEKARQTYHRLGLMEDSAVVLRVTHAPERLLFNISTGKMTQNYADEYVRKFAQQMMSKKVATPDGNDVMGVYNPVTMLKSYIFGKSDGNDGTSVESVGSSASYDEMSDVEYFLRQFLKSMKVPFSRYKTPENMVEKNDSITYEEYSFMRQEIRFQRRFAIGFKRSFITHLKLLGIWDKKTYNLTEHDIDIQFVKPVLYDLYETQKLIDAKVAIYKAFTDNDEFAKHIAMKKYLGFTDADIEENDREIIREKQMTAVADYFADSISEDNPPVDFKSPIRRKSDVEAEEKLNRGSGGDKDGENPDENSSAEAGDEGADSGGGDEMGGGDEGGGDEPPEAETGTPTFGLG